MELENYFVGTYGKNLLSDWPLITQFIQEQTQWVKDTVNLSSDFNAKKTIVLTDLQLNDIFNGPYQQFFIPHLKAYVNIAKIEAALTITKEDFFKETDQEVTTPFGFSADFIAEFEFSTLKEIHNKLVGLTEEHYKQWTAQYESWTETLSQELKKEKIHLSDLEQQEFKTNQPVSELSDRFININVDVPKLKKGDFNFHQYFTLKCTLAIHSSLSRSQLPNTREEIEKVLKHLYSPLKTIHQTEKKLAGAQEKALEELTKSLVQKK